MKKLICILSALAVLLSAFSICFTVSADNVKYRLVFTEKELIYDTAKDGWVKDPTDLVASTFTGYSYLQNDGSAVIRKFVAPKAGSLKAQNWGSGVWVDNTSGLYTGATFDFAITDSNGDIIYPTNGDVATIVEGTALNELVDFGTVSEGEVFYFVAMNASVAQLPIVINYALRTDDGTDFHASGRLYGGTVQGAGGWYQMYADTVDKLDPATLVPKTYALDFTTNQMSWSETYSAWSADGTSSALIYADASYGTTDNSLVPIRQFIMPEDGDIRLAWGVGLTTSSGTAKFAITDSTGKIIYPADGGAITLSTTAHVIDTTLAGLKRGDAVYLVTWDYSDAGAKVNFHTAFNVNDVSYANNGCYPYGDNSAQGVNGWYYLYATSITEVAEEDYRDMTALTEVIAKAETYSDLSAYTDASAASLANALTAAKAITKANTQNEINAAAAALDNAIKGLTLKPTAPAEKIVAFEFDESLMTWDSANSCWTAGAGKNSTTVAAYSIINTNNSALAIRKFTLPVSGSVRLAWGIGASIGNGTAKFAIADKYKKVVYGPVDISSGTPHTFDLTFENAAVDDSYYFIIYDSSVDGNSATVHTAVNLNNEAYADNGNLWSSANTQGDNGFYYIYADNFKAVKESEYKNLDELIAEVNKAEAISDSILSKCTDASVSAFKTALSEAKQITNASSQSDIDAAVKKLKDTFKALAPKATDKNVKSVSFTEKLMTYNSNMLYWTAENDNTCIIGPAINISSTLFGSGNTAIRKLVMPKDGDLQIKWGTGVFIDNASGNYDDTFAEFIIADKNGNILYPTNGGAAKIEEGKPLVLDLTVNGLKRGDAVYFITLNPSVENLPVIYNFGAVVAGQALQNESGNLYGVGGAQGAKNWYYLSADDLAFSTSTVGTAPSVDETKPSGSEDKKPSGSVPNTGDNRTAVPVIVLIISASVCLLTLNQFRTQRGKHQR